MSTPIEFVAALTVGSVESVSPSEIRVLLDPDAPQATALNTGSPTGFPRINGYVLIPNEVGAVIGMVTWMGVERSVYPKRTGLHDFGLVDLPFPLRKLVLTPLGTLRVTGRTASGECSYRLDRGVSSFPCVGDPVHLPTAEQLRGIIEACDDSDRRVALGTSPLAASASVTVDPDKLFGRHLAVLGNTGSGKSCSVAGLIRWSLDAARQSREEGGHANARFIILDPNGEYSQAFADLPDVRLFRVPPAGEPARDLVLPAWMWNSHEWAAFARAAPGVQRPLLLQALREMRSGALLGESAERQCARAFRYYEGFLARLVNQAPSAREGFPGCNTCGFHLLNMAADGDEYAPRVTGPLAAALQTLAGKATEVAYVFSAPWQGP